MTRTFDMYRQSMFKDHFAGMSEQMVELVKAVYDHADAHYNEGGGWHVIAECYQPSLIAAELAERMSTDEAIDVWRSVVEAWEPSAWKDVRLDSGADGRSSPF